MHAQSRGALDSLPVKFALDRAFAKRWRQFVLLTGSTSNNLPIVALSIMCVPDA